MKNLKKTDQKVYSIINSELVRQKNTLEMIASENFTDESVLEATGSVLTNKYAEGYPDKRYYGGCSEVDRVEYLAIDRAKKLFDCEYANVQPHSGSQANMGVFQALLSPGDTVVGLNLAHGGHLTHGSNVNFSGKLYNFINYGVTEDTHRVDFDALNKLVKQEKPKLIICGGSAYPRFIEFEKFKEIAIENNVYLMADIAHPSGLIASGVHPSPWPHCDIVTSTTHKTLRGPRGGIILSGLDKENNLGIVAKKSGRTKLLSEIINSAIMPGIQGGPLMHVIAAKAVAFKNALSPSFKKYCISMVNNAKELSDSLQSIGYTIVTGGTDTHLILIDLTNKNISGKKAEQILDKAGITVNKNMVPYDNKSPMITSGIRLGTPALTTRGMGVDEMRVISSLIDKALQSDSDEMILNKIKEEVKELCDNNPLYTEISDFEMSKM